MTRFSRRKQWLVIADHIVVYVICFWALALITVAICKFTGTPDWLDPALAGQIQQIYEWCEGTLKPAE